MPLFKKLFNRSKPSPVASPKAKAPAEPAPKQAGRRGPGQHPSRASQAASSSTEPQPPEVPTTSVTITVAAVQQRLGQVRDDLLQPIREVLENDFSEDVSSILDMLLAEAGTGMEQLQQQVEVCVAEERFDVLEEISTLASEFQELQDAAGQWRRGCTVHLQMPMTTRQQEEAQEAWLREEDQRRQEEEARVREQEAVSRAYVHSEPLVSRQEAARQEARFLAP